MDKDFENAVIDEFGKLRWQRFKVNHIKSHIFMCGGEVDGGKAIPPSLRDRLCSFSSVQENKSVFNATILAESFKDYFKENIFNNLLMFEDAIASISSVILIFLESPGSLVEFGMFASRPEFYQKLIIVAPHQDIQKEDSFIFLGPLEHIKKHSESSVLVYPWPDNKIAKYDNEHLQDLYDHVNSKLQSIPKQSKFNKDESGHMSHLVYEIVRLSYPILFGEIEMALMALDLEQDQTQVRRHLYMLEKLNFIAKFIYGTYTFYYPLLDARKAIQFGKDKNDRILDSLTIQMSINQSYVLNETDQARKRRTAKKEIRKLLVEQQK
ncbi:retron St85 family effector protein [Alteromonas flava]|uniref:retron St85 family effector protein n=1 Tax=Alteromonas flava TaxID=2048003 RepID=UPI000C292EA8|nr:retron St85 family effector protein [Alteromonas flava]